MVIEAIDIICILCCSGAVLSALRIFLQQSYARLPSSIFQIAQLSCLIFNGLYSVLTLLTFVLISLLNAIPSSSIAILLILKDFFFIYSLSLCISATLLKYQRLKESLLIKSSIPNIFLAISWLSSTISFTISTIARFQIDLFYIDNIVYASAVSFHILSEFWFLYKIINIILEQKEGSNKKRLLYLYYGGLFVSALAFLLIYIVAIAVNGIDKKIIYIAVVAVPFHVYCSINLLILAVFVKKQRNTEIECFKTTRNRLSVDEVDDLESYVDMRKEKKLFLKRDSK